MTNKEVKTRLLERYRELSLELHTIHHQFETKGVTEARIYRYCTVRAAMSLIQHALRLEQKP